jgi:enoyl-[acyl-carrier protein] reductase/trans-2-enoyl-CoA reductase (NAD+)
VSVNKSMVTQAAAAIPSVPLYISFAYKVMKERGVHEGTIEQIDRLFREHVAPGQEPELDEAGRIRIDDLEMRDDVQAAIEALWSRATSANVADLADIDEYQLAFRRLFGFDVPGVDYSVPVETDRPLPE